MGSRVRRLDFEGLYAALDGKRCARGMTWTGVAEEICVALTILDRTRQVGRMETDGIPAMMHWLGQAPESFILGDEGILNTGPAGLKYIHPVKHRRFDTKAPYRALDEERRLRGITRQQLSREIGDGVTPSMLAHRAKGGRVEVTFMVNVVGWLGESIENFIW
jgi:hypothetical protein